MDLRRRLIGCAGLWAIGGWIATAHGQPGAPPPAVPQGPLAQQGPPMPQGLLVQQGPLAPRGNLGQILDAADDEPGHAALDTGVLRRPPRELQRQLQRAERARDRGDYQDQVDLLVPLLQDTLVTPDASRSDFLMNPTAAGTAAESLRSAAWKLIRDLPEAGRDHYELRVGADAADALQQAVAQRNPARLRDVVAKYRYTVAGDEALFLLGRYYLDRGEPRAAARCLTQLADSPHSASYGPQLTLLRALAEWQAGDVEQSVALLQAGEATGTTYATARGPRQFQAGVDPVAQLEEWLGPLRRPATPTLRNWMLHRGSLDRNPSSAEGGTPLPTPRWRARVALVSPEEERHLAEQTAAFIRAHEPSMPTIAPLAVDNTVLMRSTDRLIAIDFASGKYLWEWPWEEQIESDESLEDPTGASPEPMPGRLKSIEQRIWDDAPYGQIASDGQAVYLLHGLDMPWQQSFGLQRMGGPVPLFVSNELVALDLPSQGKFLWRVGGPTGFSEPQLADVFFMGPPLPHGDNLYVIGELRGEVVLFCLQRNSGKLQWSQQLGFVQTGSDLLRRLVGASPSLQDDVLVCPTSCGAIVAIDLTTHALLWGYQYARAEERHRPREVWSPRMPLTPRTDRWLDATLTLADGTVLASPPEADELICLDLHTGEKRWSLPRTNEDGLTWWFVAGVDQGRVLTVGATHVACWNLADGKLAWESPLELPGQTSPSGRGYQHDHRYFLPTTQPALLEIDLAQGKFDIHPTPVPLGNTISYREHLISQSATELTAYHQREALSREVARKLETNPQDPWSLEHGALLALDAGQVSQAIDTLRKALEQYAPRDPARAPVERLLFDALLHQLRHDISNAALAQEAAVLASTPQQHLQLLRLKIESYLEAGQHMAAAEELLQMNRLAEQGRAWRGLPEGAARRFELDDKANTQEAYWLARRFQDVWDRASTTERQALDAQVAQLDQTLPGDLITPRRERFATVFQAFPTSVPATIQLAHHYWARHDLLGAELLLRDAAYRLQRVNTTPPPPLNLETLATLGEAFQKSEQRDALRTVMTMLQIPGLVSANLSPPTNLGPAGDDTDRPQSAADWHQQFATWLQQQPTIAWPEGRIDVKLSTAQVSPSDGPREAKPVRRNSEGGGIPWTVKLNHQMHLSLHNTLGREISRVHLPSESMMFQPFIEIGQYGPLLALTTRNQMAIIDTSTPRGNPQDIIRWTQPLDESMPMNSALAIRQTPVTNWPWGDRRAVVHIQGQAFRPRLGPVLPQGVCFVSGGRIVCANPLTGERIWDRPTRTRTVDIWGDATHLFVAYDDAETADVLSMVDGEMIGTRPVPPADRRWSTVGRHVLTWVDDPATHQRTVQFVDPWQGEVVWSVPCAESSKGCLLDDEQLALLETSGAFSIRNLRDGQVVVSAQLEPEPTLSSIQVTRLRDQYLLWTDIKIPDESRPRMEQYSATSPGFASPLYGRAYAFARDTGSALWSVPAFIDQYVPVPGLPSDVPLVVLARHTQKMNDPGRRTADVMVMDVRDGRLIWQGSRPAGQHPLGLVADADLHRARLSLSDGTAVEFVFTDKPRPPAPAAQTGRAASRAAAAASLQKITGAVLRAFDQLNPLQGDPFGDNLDDEVEAAEQPAENEANEP